jgi:hypothetical protein
MEQNAAGWSDVEALKDFRIKKGKKRHFLQGMDIYVYH